MAKHGDSHIVPPGDVEGNSISSHEPRSEVKYSGEVRAGLGSVNLDPVAAKPTKTDKRIKSVSIK